MRFKTAFRLSNGDMDTRFSPNYNGSCHTIRSLLRCISDVYVHVNNKLEESVLLLGGRSTLRVVGVH